MADGNQQKVLIDFSATGSGPSTEQAPAYCGGREVKSVQLLWSQVFLKYFCHGYCSFLTRQRVLWVTLGSAAPWGRAADTAQLTQHSFTESTHRITAAHNILSWKGPPRITQASPCPCRDTPTIPPWASLAAPGALAASGLCPFPGEPGQCQHL